jgi:polyphosphate kinase
VGVREITAFGLPIHLRFCCGFLVAERARCLQRQILPALRKVGIHVVDYGQLSDKQRLAVDQYFSETVFPTLTPLAFDPGRPFPHISNLSLNLAVLIRDKDGNEHFARVKIPNSIPQLVAVGPVPPENGDKGRRPSRRYFIWLEQLVVANLEMLFPGMTILEAPPSTQPGMLTQPCRNWRRGTCWSRLKKASGKGALPML